MPLKLPTFCFGCEPLGGVDWGNVDLELVSEAVSLAVQTGHTFFDTAAVYGLGLSEIRLAQALGAYRTDSLIATKGGLTWSNTRGRACVLRDSSPSALVSHVEASLRRLSIDTIPIYYIHWPDPSTSFLESLDALESLRNRGLIRFIGLSNFSSSMITTASNYADISVVQTPVSRLFPSDHIAVCATCKSLDIPVVAYNVLASGLLSGKYNKHSTFLATDRRSRLPHLRPERIVQTLSTIASIKAESDTLKMPLLTYSVLWALSQESVSSVILGIKSPAQLLQNLEAISVASSLL